MLKNVEAKIAGRVAMTMHTSCSETETRPVDTKPNFLSRIGKVTVASRPLPAPNLYFGFVGLLGILLMY